MDSKTEWALEYLERMGEKFKDTMHPDMRAALDRIMLCARDHNEEFVVMFLGFMAARGLCKPGIEPQELLDVWAAFKEQMGKEVVGSASSDDGKPEHPNAES